MATITAPAQAKQAARTEYPAGGLRFDWAYIGLATLFIAGLFVDGWAHFHGEVDGSFFTPWHFLFYSAFGFVALFTGYHQLRNVNQGYAFAWALPRGYWLALVGVVTFGLGGMGDMVWHTLFGIEEGTEALLSPTHMLLAIGMMLITTAPLRAAWHRYPVDVGSDRLRKLAPAILSTTLALILFGFFTSYAHPLVYPGAAVGEPEGSPQSAELYVMNADGTGQTRLTNNPEQASSLGVWSPDGSQILYVQDLPGDDSASLYIMDADGSNARELLNLGGALMYPSWSPDGRQISFVKRDGDAVDLFVADADGENVVQITDDAAVNQEGTSAWSPDGRQLIFGADANDTSTVYVVDSDGSNLRPLIEGYSAGGASWSPDGKKILFTGSADGQDFEIFTANADGSDIQPVTNNDTPDYWPVFTAEGDAVVYVSVHDDRWDVYRVPVSGGEAVNLTNNPALGSYAPTVAADGRILYTALGAEVDDIGFSQQDFGVTGILLQAGFMAGAVLLLAKRWVLPFGAFTLLFTLNSAAMVVLTDLFFFIPAGIIAGLVVDGLARRLKPATTDNLHLFAFLAPVVYFALYMLTIQIAVGIQWNIHVWAGAIVLSGLVGLLLSYLPVLDWRGETVEA